MNKEQAFMEEFLENVKFWETTGTINMYSKVPDYIHLQL